MYRQLVAWFLCDSCVRTDSCICPVSCQVFYQARRISTPPIAPGSPRKIVPFVAASTPKWLKSGQRSRFGFRLSIVWLSAVQISTSLFGGVADSSPRRHTQAGECEKYRMDEVWRVYWSGMQGIRRVCSVIAMRTETFFGVREPGNDIPSGLPQYSLRDNSVKRCFAGVRVSRCA